MKHLVKEDEFLKERLVKQPMYDEYEKSPRKWTFEEIDELLQDSGISSEQSFEPEVVPSPIKNAEAVNPRPVHNDEIEHKIITSKVEKSGVDGGTRVFAALESDKYRDRFLNKPMHNLEKTAEHKFVPLDEQPYERGGFIKKASNFKVTGELEPVPILVSEDILRKEQEEKQTKEIKNEKTIALRSLAVTDADANEIILEEDDDMQLSFEGFNVRETVTTVDEEEIERELIKKRRKKAAEFVVSTEPQEEDEEEPISKKLGLDEYRSLNDKRKVYLYLKKKQQKSAVAILANVCCLVFTVVLSLYAEAKFEPNSLVHANEFPVILLNFLLLLTASFFSKDIISDGIQSFKGFKFNRNSGSAAAVILALVQNFLFFFAPLPFEDKLSLYSPLAVFTLLCNSLALFSEAKRLRKNFAVVSQKELYSISHIERKETAFEIGRGLLLDEPIVLSSQKTKFPGRFIELSKKYYPADEINKRLVPIVLLVSLIVGVAVTIKSGNVFNGVSAFTALITVATPSFIFLSDTVSINLVSNKLKKNGGVITGWEATRMCASANGITIDSTDVFDKNGGNVYGMKSFHSMKIDEAILYTAALLVASGGALGNLFKRVIMDRTELLPPVDTLAYEDKLGLSAWVQNRRVLVGRYELLKNHSVEVPDKSFVEKYSKEGRYPLFLAIEGKLAAMFVVSYDIDEENAKYLKQIEKESISLLLRTDDANITDDMVAKNISVPTSGVKVLSAVSGDILNSYKKEVRTAADSVLMHDGKSSSYLASVAAALSLGRIKQSAATLQIGASVVLMALTAVLSIISDGTDLAPAALLVAQAVFAIIGYFNVKLKV